ncbi:MAG: hypothetical protein II797_01190, partial [Clostridia bacterium]|nr:hypothetical protein [Clostridia bacterium]
MGDFRLFFVFEDPASTISIELRLLPQRSSNMATKTPPKKNPAENTQEPEAKKKALATAVSQIEKTYGKGSIIRMGENPRMDISSVSTG